MTDDVREILEEMFGPGGGDMLDEQPSAPRPLGRYTIERTGLGGPDTHRFAVWDASREGKEPDAFEDDRAPLVRLFRTYAVALRVAQEGTLGGYVDQPGLATYNASGPWDEVARIDDGEVVWQHEDVAGE